MLIYGVGTSKGNPVRISRNCSECQAVNSLFVIPVHKYVHFFFIPSFCCGKDYILKCDSCGFSYQGEVTVEKNISRDIKPPIWMFSGLILFVLFFTYIIWEDKTAPERNKKQALEYIESPQVGDIYEVKSDSAAFTLYKVSNVIGDSIYFPVHDFEVTKALDLSELQRGEYVDKYTAIDAYTKNELKQVAETGTIMKINR